MSRYEEIAHEVAAEGTEAAWAARDAILELVAEVSTLWQLVDEHGKHQEVLERTALKSEEINALQAETLSMQAETIQGQRETIAKQADLLRRQDEAIKRLMGKGVLHA